MMQGDDFEAFKQEHVLEEMSVAEILRAMREEESLQDILDYEIQLDESGISLGAVLDTLLTDQEVMDRLAEEQAVPTTTVGDVLDLLNAEGLLEKYKDVTLGKEIYVRDLIAMLADSEDRGRDLLQNKIADASYNSDYDNTQGNIMQYWLTLLLFVLAFAALSIITLEFIDKDKR